MSTLTGIIKAATSTGIDEIPARSDLHIFNEFLLLTSKSYGSEIIDSVVSTFTVDAALRPIPKYFTGDSAGLDSISFAVEMKSIVLTVPPVEDGAGLGSISFAANLVDMIKTAPDQTISAGLDNIQFSVSLLDVIVEMEEPQDGVKGTYNVEVYLESV